MILGDPWLTFLMFEIKCLFEYILKNIYITGKKYITGFPFMDGTVTFPLKVKAFKRKVV